MRARYSHDLHPDQAANRYSQQLWVSPASLHLDKLTNTVLLVFAGFRSRNAARRAAENR